MKELLKCLYLYFINLKNIFAKNNNIKGLPFKYMLGGAKLRINGVGNTIVCKTRHIGKVVISIYGNNHYLEIGENVVFKKGQVWFEDEGNSIIIGNDTTIEDAALSAVERNMSLAIGCDCMLSSGIVITTTDSHSIIDKNTGNRLNMALPVTIGNHVWIGRNCSINKGVTVSDNAVIGSNTLVTHDVPSNTVFGGIPGKVLKENISWSRKRF